MSFAIGTRMRFWESRQYVDDLCVVGKPRVVAVFMSFVNDTWTTKFAGFMTRGSEQTLSHGSFVLQRVDEITFIGLQICFDQDGHVKYHQQRWILNELPKRNWIHLVGSQSLPQVDLQGADGKDAEDYKATLEQAQMEIGCLMWISAKTPPDLLSIVSIAALHLHKCPSAVLKVARGCWRYLRGTIDVGLRFVGAVSCESVRYFFCTCGKSISGWGCDHLTRMLHRMVELQADCNGMECM